MVLNFLRARFLRFTPQAPKSRPKLEAIGPAPAGTRIYAGRIIPLGRADAPSRRHRHQRDKKTFSDFLQTLQRMVKSYGRYEASHEDLEKLELDLATRIEIEMKEDGTFENEERVGNFYDNLRKLEKTIELDEKNLEVLGREVVGFLESEPEGEDEEEMRKLPLDVVEQIWRVENARVVYTRQRFVDDIKRKDFVGELAVLDRMYNVLRRGRRSRPKGGGWHETEQYYERMMERREDMLKRRRVVECCRRKWRVEVRELCRGYVPKVLKGRRLDIAT